MVATWEVQRVERTAAWRGSTWAAEWVWQKVGWKVALWDETSVVARVWRRVEKTVALMADEKAG